jgi:hypothetical protein
MSTLPSVDLQENAERNLSIAIGRLEEMRWAVSGVDSPSTECLVKFDEGLAKLKEALAAIQASPSKLLQR